MTHSMGSAQFGPCFPPFGWTGHLLPPGPVRKKLKKNNFAKTDSRPPCLPSPPLGPGGCPIPVVPFLYGGRFAWAGLFVLQNTGAHSSLFFSAFFRGPPEVKVFPPPAF